MSIEHQEVIDLIGQELIRAAQKHGPAFASYHEGYAVLLEEWQELQDETNEFERKLQAVWMDIRRDTVDDGNVYSLYVTAARAACEALQTAAMCKKLLDMVRKS